MSVRSAVLRGRRFADRVLIAEGTVTRVTGLTVSGGFDVPTTAMVYSGPLAVARSGTAAGQAEVAGASVTVQRVVVKFPVGAYVMQLGDVVTVTQNDLDPSMLGAFRLVAEDPSATESVLYRVAAERAL